MPRVLPKNPPPNTSSVADAIRVRRGARGLTPLDQILLHSDPIADGWNKLLAGVRTGSIVDAGVREAMICRVAALNGAAFEWIQHAPLALQAGVTPAQLGVIRDTVTPLPALNTPEADSSLSPVLLAAVHFTDYSTLNIQVPLDLYNHFKELLVSDSTGPTDEAKEKLIVEASAVVACYNMVSRFLVTNDVGDYANTRVPLPTCETTEHMVEVEAGVELSVRVDQHATGDKPWILCVNSLLTEKSMWDLVTPTLAQQYNVITFDQRGHGKSSTSPEACTLEILATDVVKICKFFSINQLEAVIGVSQGGATLLALLAENQDIAKRFIICDTQVTSPEANIKAWDVRIQLAREQGMLSLANATVPRWFSYYNTGEQMGLASNGLGFNEQKRSWLESMVESTSVEGFAQSARALQGYDLAPRLQKTLSEKSPKILFVAGSNDGGLPGVLERANEQFLDLKVDSRFEVIKGAGHLPMVDFPRQFIGVVSKFLNSA